MPCLPLLSLMRSLRASTESSPARSIARPMRAGVGFAVSLAALSVLAPSPARTQALDLHVDPVAKPTLERTVGPLGPGDVRKSETQRARVEALARRHLGVPVGRDTATDLDALQRLIDGGWVEPGDVYLQQALGVVLGDALARDLRILTWATVDDRYGHSRALRYRTTDQVFFPVTMISKRMEADERIDVRALYDDVKAHAERLEADRDAHLRRTRGRR